MKDGPYTIKVGSQKGGVGKTTVSVNLATLLSMLNYSVLLVDADTINPSVGFYLGLEDVNIGYMDVIKRRVSAQKATVKHDVTGMSVLPGTTRINPTLPTHNELAAMMRTVRRTKYDFIITDTPPGMYTPGTSKLYNEAIIVSTPDMSSVTTAVRLGHVYNKERVKHSLVINRVRDKRYELSISEIEEAYGTKVQCVLPEDEVIPKSVARHVPALLVDGRAPFSRAMKDCGRFFASSRGTEGREATMAETTLNIRSSGGIVGWIRRLFGFGR